MQLKTNKNQVIQEIKLYNYLITNCIINMNTNTKRLNNTLITNITSFQNLNLLQYSNNKLYKYYKLKDLSNILKKLKSNYFKLLKLDNKK